MKSNYNISIVLFFIIATMSVVSSCGNSDKDKENLDKLLAKLNECKQKYDTCVDGCPTFTQSESKQLINDCYQGCYQFLPPEIFDNDPNNDHLADWFLFNSCYDDCPDLPERIRQNCLDDCLDNQLKCALGEEGYQIFKGSD